MGRSAASLRIVAGEFGGRRIAGPDGERFRPTAERTREAVFSMLGPVDGDSVLDLYCGSGALGFEALSRGAGDLTLVDRAIDLARENAVRLGVGGRCRLHEDDALGFLGADDRLYDLVLLDPPYRLADRLGPQLDHLLSERLTPTGRIVVESAGAAPMRLSLPLLRERRYGRSLVRIHEREAG